MKHLIPILLFLGCAPTVPSFTKIEGPTGGSGVEGPTGDQGLAGIPGLVGPTGPQGLPGHSCTVSSNSLGALVICPDGTSALILNGKDGQDGSSHRDNPNHNPGPKKDKKD